MKVKNILFMLLAAAAILVLNKQRPALSAEPADKPIAAETKQETIYSRTLSEPTGGFEEAEFPTANVLVDGKLLFRVRGVSAYPAERRAQVVTERIKSLARDPKFKVETLRSEETDAFTQIMAGDFVVIRVFDADAKIEGLQRNLLVAAYLNRIHESIEEYRRDRSIDKLVSDALYALLATAIFAVILIVLVKLGRRLNSLLENRYKRHLQTLEIQSFEIVRSEQIWTALQGLSKIFRAIIMLALAYAYLNFVLSLFPWTRTISKHLLDYVIGPITTIGTAVLNYIPKLVFLIILIIITRYVLKVLRTFFDVIARGALTLPNFDPEWSQPTYRIVRFTVIAFAVVVAYPYIPGSDSAAFKGVSLFIGVLFSLGSSSVISNIIAGYSMTYRRAFRQGDRIRINDSFGDVVEMRLLVTHLRSPKNEEIVIPNSIILNSQVINYSSIAHTRGLILHTNVGIGYEVPWRQVEAMLHMAAERTPGVLKEPAPFVLQKSLDDYCITYELNVHCNDARQMAAIYTELHHNILDVFNEYGVQIMTPSYESDPEQPKLVTKDQWYAAPAKESD